MAQLWQRGRAVLALAMNIRPLLLIGLFTCAAVADTVFVDRFTTNGITLERRGTARMKWGGWVSLYDAALYLPAGTPSDQVFEDQPKRLEICYLKNFSRNLLVEAGTFPCRWSRRSRPRSGARRCANASSSSYTLKA